jgi:Zn-finger nucleic acid-binding protein
VKCPMDGSALVMSERQGVEIDYCPQCRGVWLDRGELDKILERAPDMQSSPPAARASEDRYREDQRPHQGHHKKRQSWLSDLFD